MRVRFGSPAAPDPGRRSGAHRAARAHVVVVVGVESAA
eukprot:SAG11_NODE_35100_length_268_cov_0.917160_1_plen_37_part_10